MKYLGNAVTAFKVVVGCGERDPGPKPRLDTVQPLDFRKVMALLRPSVSSSGNWEHWDEWKLLPEFSLRNANLAMHASICTSRGVSSLLQDEAQAPQPSRPCRLSVFVLGISHLSA